MLTMQEVRRQYPHPVCGDGTKRGRLGTLYCVGGALHFAMEFSAIAFPSTCDLAEALQECNPSLSEAETQTYAVEIILANDTGNFDDAWQWLDKALTPQEEILYVDCNTTSALP